MVRCLLLLLLFSSSVVSERAQIFYQIQKGAWVQAIANYENYCAKAPQEAGTLSAQMAEMFLREAMRSKEESVRALALHAGVLTKCSKFLPFFMEGLKDANPLIASLAIRGIENIHNDQANELLLAAIQSSNPAVALEAAHCLMERQHDAAVLHVEALMYRVPQEAKIFFPLLFGPSKHPIAQAQIVRLLNDPQIDVRVTALQTVLEHKIEICLPQLRVLAERGNAAEQELAIQGLALFQDSHSIDLLKRLLQSPDPLVRISAALALESLCHEGGALLLQEAQRQNSWAICALGSVENIGRELLVTYLQGREPLLRVCAMWALLQRKDPIVLEPLQGFLIQSSAVFIKRTSMGGTLMTFKAGSEPDWQAPWILKARLLPQEAFLSFAKTCLSHSPGLAAPILTAVATIHTPEASLFLQQAAHYPRQPLLRVRAEIALAQEREAPECLLAIEQWVRYETQVDLWALAKEKTKGVTFQEVAVERADLFVEALLTIAEIKREESLPLLWELFQRACPNNRPFLAALILLVTQ